MSAARGLDLEAAKSKPGAAGKGVPPAGCSIPTQAPPPGAMLGPVATRTPPRGPLTPHPWDPDLWATLAPTQVTRTHGPGEPEPARLRIRPRAPPRGIPRPASRLTPAVTPTTMLRGPTQFRFLGPGPAPSLASPRAALSARVWPEFP